MIGPAPFVERYLEMRYKPSGRDESGVDCFGLIRMVLKKEARIGIPSYDSIDPNDKAAVRSARLELQSIPGLWFPFPIAQSKVFDIVPMFDEHVGIMVSNIHVLHCETDSVGPCCELISKLSIRSRLTPRHNPLVYRHQSLCSKNS